MPAHLQIVSQQQHDYLRFSNGIQEIRDANGNVVSELLASQYAYHPAHNHWHLGDVAVCGVGMPNR